MVRRAIDACPASIVRRYGTRLRLELDDEPNIYYAPPEKSECSNNPDPGLDTLIGFCEFSFWTCVVIYEFAIYILDRDIACRK